MILELALCALLTQETKLTVEAAAIVVARDVGLGENEPGPFNQNEPGTKIALLVKSSGPGILGVEDKKSRIASMKDDKGNDLLAAKPKKDGGFSRTGLWPFPKIAKDGKSCVLEVHAHGLPAKGARSIQVEGTLALLTAQGQEAVKQADVKLQAGTKIKAGELELAVEKVGKDGFNDLFPFQVSFSGGKGGRSFSKVRFLDAAGKEIESRPGSVSRMSGFGDETWSWEYNLKSEVKACALEITLWRQLSEASVPFKLEVSLGL